jgi:hypothetical protein
MAAITFDATHQKEHIRKRLETVFAAFGEMLDAFVSNRMRRLQRRPRTFVPGSP